MQVVVNLLGLPSGTQPSSGQVRELQTNDLIIRKQKTKENKSNMDCTRAPDVRQNTETPARYHDYLAKACSTRRFHLALFAEVLIMCVEHTAWKTRPSHHLIVLLQPTHQNRIMQWHPLKSSHNDQTNHCKTRGLEHFRCFSDFGLDRTIRK